MALKLTDRAGVWQVTGTVRLPSGAKFRVRQSTGCPIAERPSAEAMLAEISAELARLHGRGVAGAPPHAVTVAPSVTVADVIVEVLLRPDVGAPARSLLGALARDLGPRYLRDLDLAEILGWFATRLSPSASRVAAGVISAARGHGTEGT